MSTPMEEDVTILSQLDTRLQIAQQSNLKEMSVTTILALDPGDGNR